MCHAATATEGGKDEARNLSLPENFDQWDPFGVYFIFRLKLKMLGTKQQSKPNPTNANLDDGSSINCRWSARKA